MTEYNWIDQQNIVFIISRYTSPNRTPAYHADNGDGEPLCGDQPRGRFNGWARDVGSGLFSIKWIEG